MSKPFTLHCIAWQAGAPLLLEMRSDAYQIGLLSASEVLPDETDMQGRHALALGINGRCIGCARITPDGVIDRLAVLPHDQRDQIEAALIEELNAYAEENKLAVHLDVRSTSKSNSAATAY
jgi:ribosomal protein S18 acetylase RimI-like enzyme